MKRILFIFLIHLFPLLLFAQQTITVVSNVKVTFSEKRGTYRWYSPVFAHEGSTLSADSADYNQGDNFFDAYGNVVITQPNGTVVHADKLHYTESTQEAILTNHVRLIDRQATLTTDYLTYNMRSKIGTYLNGGQILNGTDTLTSKNGYYFENSQDAYFRHNVVVRTPDVQINTDTMRYNSGSKMTYFYGPTTIDGKNGRLYTENGDYNTETDKAKFGKNNLYTEGSKFLWGDSLIYDGVTGNGRAVKNVNFVDTTQHIVMRGQLGTYNKATQTTLVTENAYIVLATKSDSTEKSVQKDTLTAEPAEPLADSDSLRQAPPSKMDSTYLSADTLLSQVIKLKDYKYTNIKMSREGGELEIDETGEQEPAGPPADRPETPVPNPKGEIDSLKNDSLTTGIVKKILPDTLAAAADSLKAPVIDKARSQDSIKSVIPENLPIDSTNNLTDSLPLPPQKSDVDSLTNRATNAALAQHRPDSLVSDTAETRIVIAFHDVRIYKSDLQAIADSAYFGYPDSIIRCFGKPMIWAQGSQLSADTVYMQLKNQKMDNMLLQNKAFIASTELDSTKYNQVKGKKISGFFANNEMDRVFVDGNAESVYYTVEDNKFSGMARSISGRIKVLFKDNKMTDVISIRKAATTYYPIAEVPNDQEFLEGFIWKPELRPTSKEEVINRGPARRTIDEEPAKTDSIPTQTDSTKTKSTIEEGNTATEPLPKEPSLENKIPQKEPSKPEEERLESVQKSN